MKESYSELSEALSESLYRELPVLIEARFPRMGTQSDWHLCSTDEELDELLSRLGEGARLLAVPVDNLNQDAWIRVRPKRRS